jgi:ubiquinone/menaquinone biosynthesis C-methylase UbiE
MTAVPNVATRLQDVREAFDSVAAQYDGRLGNNLVIQRMRSRLWTAVERQVPRGATLLDLGCGTGLDAVHFAERGYRVIATDWSPEMVRQTQERAEQAGVLSLVDPRVLGMQDLDRLEGSNFDAAYSNLGALNCVPDLRAVSESTAAVLSPSGRLIVSVIGRICPWEVLFYLVRGRPKRALVRASRHMVPVPLNGHTVWTRYFTPHDFARRFEAQFDVESVRGLCIAAPPPYLFGAWERLPVLCEWAASLDDLVGPWPVVRQAGDHFLMVLTRKP